MSKPVDHNSENEGLAGVALPASYTEMLDDIRGEIATAQSRVVRAVNAELIAHYWRIGKIILDRQRQEGWGTKVMDRLAVDLRAEFPERTGFSRTNLKYMRKFAALWPNGIGQQAVDQLPWGHITILLGSLDTRAEQDFYAAKAVQHGWSRAVMTHMIRSGLHLREGVALHNFDAVVPEQSDLLRQITREPYNLEFLRLADDHAERELEDALVAQLVAFLQELGVGFAFVGRQYRLDVGGDEFLIDLLFYHLKLHRYVVIELKTVKATPEHIGKLGFYVAVVDDLVRDSSRDDPTIGILIAAGRNASVVQYALNNSRQPMAVSTYGALTPEMQALLPSADDLGRVARRVLEARGESVELPRPREGDESNGSTSC
ncbi:PDDEXK nuclease domain-containing protein [Yinghuangia soli]|uniref:PDDEXK nuclease domain-containing protein n=1 Tax=Yinghuangia soli TaxID=2908204 RepID=A0AA41PYU3_9ACTN|nr:PDDEXK nuclease domain-containing protein [Yinghuangia soli]MCF2528385.1 PDDEXK nuclease domain-containing protein [Yinghuangia soli]